MPTGHRAGGVTRLRERNRGPGKSDQRALQGLPVPTIPSGELCPSHLPGCPSRPTAMLVSSQMWAPWKAWPITVAGTRCTGQAIRPPPSPATPWTRLAQGPLRGRLSSPCPETTTRGPLCWMSARSELRGPGVGPGRAGAGAGKTGPTVSCSSGLSEMHHLSELCLIRAAEPTGGGGPWEMLLALRLEFITQMKSVGLKASGKVRCP